MICTPELLSLTLARNRLAELSRRRIPSERVHVVLNRWHRQDMTLEDAEDFLKYKVVTALPNDYKSVNKAILSGALIPPDSELGRSIGALAMAQTRRISGRPQRRPNPGSGVDFVGQVGNLRPIGNRPKSQLDRRRIRPEAQEVRQR